MTMNQWKFSCESKSDIPLPPTYTFPQAFNYLNSQNNSFYILEHENGDYIQCGGCKKACCVELRRYEKDGTYKHYIIGRDIGTDSPAVIEMSGGAVNVRERDVLSHWEAIDLFKSFFAGEPLPSGYSLRELTL